MVSTLIGLTPPNISPAFKHHTLLTKSPHWSRPYDPFVEFIQISLLQEFSFQCTENCSLRNGLRQLDTSPGPILYPVLHVTLTVNGEVVPCSHNQFPCTIYSLVSKMWRLDVSTGIVFFEIETIVFSLVFYLLLRVNIGLTCSSLECVLSWIVNFHRDLMKTVIYFVRLEKSVRLLRWGSHRAYELHSCWRFDWHLLFVIHMSCIHYWHPVESSLTERLKEVPSSKPPSLRFADPLTRSHLWAMIHETNPGQPPHLAFVAFHEYAMTKMSCLATLDIKHLSLEFYYLLEYLHPGRAHMFLH